MAATEGHRVSWLKGQDLDVITASVDFGDTMYSSFREKADEVALDIYQDDLQILEFITVGTLLDFLRDK